MNELEFGQMISMLWASQIWGNKEYLVDKIISDNGFDEIKKRLADLVFNKSKPISERYDRFVENIKGLGPSSVTEILCYFNKEKYGIWNSKARTALKELGFEKGLPLNKYKISGKDYEKFNKTMKAISGYVKKKTNMDMDLLTLDYFLYEVWSISKEKETVIKPKKYDFDHDEIKDKVMNIGIFLGFEAETEELVQHGARVDCIWTAKIANLGVVKYVFEVQCSGSIDSLILNLQKAKTNPTVQKLVVISDRDQINKIKREIQGLPQHFTESMTFWEASDVEKTFNNLSEVNKSIEQLGLIESEFKIPEIT